jgi:hypothetical protein
MLNLGWLYRDEGKLKKAEPLFRRTLGVRDRLLGPTHPETLVALKDYGALLRKVGREKEAKDLDAKFKMLKDQADKDAKTGKQKVKPKLHGPERGLD